MSEEEHFWSFGFGSNMDITFVEKTKEVKVLGGSSHILKIKKKSGGMQLSLHFLFFFFVS